MNYDEIATATEKLSYRDKFRLAQLLIQLARKEEEQQNPQERGSLNPMSPDVLQYVAERLQKLKPSRKSSLLNSIGAMFQFQGGISEDDKERICTELLRRRQISIEPNGHVSFPQ